MRQWLDRLGDDRRGRAAWRDINRALTPPPQRAYGLHAPGALVMPPARVETPECIFLGPGVKVHEQVWMLVQRRPGMPAPRLEIGARTSINRFVKIVCTQEVIIGEDCLIGDFCVIADTSYRFGDPDLPIRDQGLEEAKPVRIGRGAHIGVRSIVMPGTTLGENAYVGAGAVVTEDVPDHAVVVGNPARVIRRYDRASGTWIKG